ncbi:uncharacterized protein LOC109831477 [Asparagus officinalis]|uniref:uncharacterized protein LOC109831477 n=1 Tax=Asparagus officinalis TaxID=4686 RepID=UPI00098E07BD|nr:uncharacterized protein LOC109831477 [Asparagus officinalis]
MAENRDWMYNAPRVSVEFINNVNDFLERAFANGAVGDEICCQCRICCNRFWYSRDVVYDHLIVKGFVENYYDWFFHGEGVSSRMDVDDNNEEADDVADDAQDNLDGLLHDVFRDVAEESPVNQEDGLSDDEERLTKEAKKFYKLVDEGIVI